VSDDISIANLKNELMKYKNGYQGACYACEPTGLLNKKLNDQLKIAIKALDYYAQSWAEASHERCAFKARQTLAKINQLDLNNSKGGENVETQE
jgi:hypothetical protein